jgi:hypothetical protein
MGLVVAIQEFVDDYSFINKIDTKGAASQFAILIVEIIW